MRRVKWLVAAGLAFSAVGCGLSIQRIAPENPLNGTKVVVQEFGMSAAHVENFDGSTSSFGLEIAQSVAKWLQQAGVQADAVPRGSVPAGVYVVKGEVLHIDGGSRALRYFISFGAGATEIAANGQVLGGKGETVGTFSDGRRSGFGMFGGDADALLHRCIDSLGNDIATMITTGQYAKNYP